ncbi:hypothetical protein [Rhizobium sp. S96]|uniref:hypothetical protein n=1 Tax=Rhizobium sp. S96 TaxID=3055140 RepID=UPI0025AA7C36|nr:hypothetical protein [Rhizobium sp. S96]MDM9620602.1 hypothetical protein [Rhizobium sp. S96]
MGSFGSLRLSHAIMLQTLKIFCVPRYKNSTMQFPIYLGAYTRNATLSGVTSISRVTSALTVYSPIVNARGVRDALKLAGAVAGAHDIATSLPSRDEHAAWPKSNHRSTGVTTVMELPSIQIDHADRLYACRQKIEEAVHRIIFGEELVEFSSAEIAMAVADIADDYILSMAKKNTARH